MKIEGRPKYDPRNYESASNIPLNELGCDLTKSSAHILHRKIPFDKWLQNVSARETKEHEREERIRRKLAKANSRRNPGECFRQWKQLKDKKIARRHRLEQNEKEQEDAKIQERRAQSRAAVCNWLAKQHDMRRNQIIQKRRQEETEMRITETKEILKFQARQRSYDKWKRLVQKSRRVAMKRQHQQEMTEQERRIKQAEKDTARERKLQEWFDQYDKKQEEKRLECARKKKELRDQEKLKSELATRRRLNWIEQVKQRRLSSAAESSHSEPDRTHKREWLKKDYVLSYSTVPSPAKKSFSI